VLPPVLKTKIFVRFPSCTSCIANYYMSVNGITYIYLQVDMDTARSNATEEDAVSGGDEGDALGQPL
jgi:hypothetical protein